MSRAFSFAIGLSFFLFGVVGFADEKADEAEIRLAVSQYVTAFNAGDAKRLASLWSENGVHVLRDSGQEVKGRQAIEKMFAEMFAAEKGTKLSVEIDSLRFVTDSVAIEDGRATVIAPGSEPEETKYTAVHVKTKDGWRLDSVRETIQASTAQAGSSYEQLKELEWMIGDWIDQSDESTVETSCRWSKNKSYMIRSFRVVAGGMDDLEGTQVVGWDAMNGQIRSWMFDSDGGFLEGNWTQKGASWIVKASGYLADGRRASSINTFTQVDENSFTWKAVGRQVDSEFLPNIEEVKVVRK